MTLHEQLEQALGRPLPPPTKKERLQDKLREQETRLHERIKQGRNRGGSAGALNRDVDAISHKIRLLQDQIKALN